MRRRWQRALVVGVDLLDPIRMARLLPLRPPPATLLSVYRQRNAARLAQLIDDLPGIPVRLWALDEPSPSLDSVTRGVGPGGRFELLNRLADGVSEDHWLLVCDDDVSFRPGGVVAFLALTARLGLDLAQPAHAKRGSNYYHRITGRRSFRLGRETTFVEIGPVLAVSPGARRRVVPFPEAGMGWGTELLWHDLRQEGLRLGIVDATPIRHHGLVAAQYDLTEEGARQQRMFDERGLSDWEEVQQTLRSRWF